MSAASRNQARKALYSSQGDKGSRNQDAIEGPLVGRFETVVDKERFGDRLPHEVLVHDTASSGATVASPRAAKREPNAQKRRRQLAAWARCARNRVDGSHPMHGSNCVCCGMPEGFA